MTTVSAEEKSLQYPIGFARKADSFTLQERNAAIEGLRVLPEKLRAAVQDDGGDPHLRGLALAALVEIGVGQDGVHALATSAAAKARASGVRCDASIRSRTRRTR